MTHGLNKKICIAVAYGATPLFQDGCTHFDISSRPCITYSFLKKKKSADKVKGVGLTFWVQEGGALRSVSPVDRGSSLGPV